jgi:hypothetical protein
VRGGEPRVARDVQQTAAGVVVVTDDVQVGLIDAHDAIAPSGKTAVVEPHEIPEYADRGSISCCEDHLVERALGAVDESGSAGCELVDPAREPDHTRFQAAPQM